MKVAAIILAAGASSRFGSLKQIALFAGMPLVRRSAIAALEAGCAPVIVVTGHESERVIASVDGLAVTAIYHPGWPAGPGSSIAAGIAALADADVDAALILACDQPAVTGQVLANLLKVGQATEQTIVASCYAGAMGIPALFTRQWFQKLRKLPTDAGAKSIIVKHPEALAKFDFPSGEDDADTPAALEALERVHFGRRFA